MVALLSQLRSARGQSDPLPLFAQLHQLGAVLPSPWGGVLVTSHHVCETILRDKAWTSLDSRWRQGQGPRWTSRSARELGHVIMSLNPPEHTQQRQVVREAFGKQTLQRLNAHIRETTDELLDQLEDALTEGPRADFVPTSEQFPIRVVGRWLGLPTRDLDRLHQLTREHTHAQELFPTPRRLEQADLASDELQAYFAAIIADRRSCPRDDVITNWLTLWDAAPPNRPASDVTVRRLAMFSLMAGLETTAALLASSVRLLAQHPEQARWLRSHPERTSMLVDEALRFDPPVQVISRVAPGDTTLAGVDIAAGQVAYLLIGAAQHDPTVYEQSDTFDVRRPGRRHLAFGAGAHYCIGAGLARTMAIQFIEALLSRLPDLYLPSPALWEPRVAFRRMESPPHRPPPLKPLRRLTRCCNCPPCLPSPPSCRTGGAWSGFTSRGTRWTPRRYATSSR
ncbi:cytochrome P450 [Kitasatospora indigofera]|uniref:cytochrome P450 n=1 Tax=Kitasatospora indigofera TaxID=67307 RepID=UPI0036A6F430